MLAGHPATIKIDVEGHEVRVLNGSPKPLASDYLHQLIVEIDEGNLQRYGNQVTELYAPVESFRFAPGRDPASSHYDEFFVRST